jgi:hypothetical protein
MWCSELASRISEMHSTEGNESMMGTQHDSERIEVELSFGLKSTNSQPSNNGKSNEDDHTEEDELWSENDETNESFDDQPILEYDDEEDDENEDEDDSDDADGESDDVSGDDGEENDGNEGIPEAREDIGLLQDEEMLDFFETVVVDWRQERKKI